MKLDEIWAGKKKLAEDGRKYWLHLLKEYDISEKEAVMVLLDRDREAAKYLLEHGSEMVEAKKFRKISVLTASKELANTATEMLRERQDASDRKGRPETDLCKNAYLDKECWLKQVICCTEKEIEGIWELYQVYKFTNQLIWGTLEGVEDADGYRLEGFHGITREQIVRVAIMDVQ